MASQSTTTRRSRSAPRKTKSFFWNSSIQLNQHDPEAVFSFSISRSTPNSPTLTIFTDDIPPYPVSHNDSLSFVLRLEANLGYSLARYKLLSFDFTGSDLPPTPTTVQETHDISKSSIQIKNSTVNFEFINKNWVIRSISITYPSAALAKFLKV